MSKNTCAQNVAGNGRAVGRMCCCAGGDALVKDSAADWCLCGVRLHCLKLSGLGAHSIIVTIKTNLELAEKHLCMCR